VALMPFHFKFALLLLVLLLLLLLLLLKFLLQPLHQQPLLLNLLP
jgi:hypothetical protein